MTETHRDGAPRTDTERRVADLLNVLETARRLATVHELATILTLIEQSTRSLLGCECARLDLRESGCDERADRCGDRAGEGPRLPEWLLSDVWRRKDLVNLANPPGDFRLPPEVRNLLACPVLASEDSPIGLLTAANTPRERFDDWDETLIRALAAQAGAAIHRYRCEVAARAHQSERDLDLDVARQIQQALLPRCPSQIRGYDIAGWYQPADETGGDFFDFQDRGPGRLAVALGDVSGHGVGPALVVAECRAFLRATLTQTDEPARVVSQINQLLCHDQLDDRFVTAFFGVLRHDTHQLDYVSAGQGPILFFSRAEGTFRELEIQGFPLGLSADLTFGPTRSVTFEPGDFLALITDGFFEWFNDRGECFGVDRMKAQIDHDRDRPAAEIIERLHAAVLDFVAGSPQPDDLTAVVIKRRE